LTRNPMRFPTWALRNPRTLCACQPVSFINWPNVRPVGDRSAARIWSVFDPAAPFFTAPFFADSSPALEKWRQSGA
jgi:hypothetical protein